MLREHPVGRQPVGFAASPSRSLGAGSATNPTAPSPTGTTNASRAEVLGIVALARKLLVALWRYLETGALPEGAILKS